MLVIAIIIFLSIEWHNIVQSKTILPAIVLVNVQKNLITCPLLLFVLPILAALLELFLVGADDFLDDCF